jgi:hypothetical protein
MQKTKKVHEKIEICNSTTEIETAVQTKDTINVLGPAMFAEVVYTRFEEEANHHFVETLPNHEERLGILNHFNRVAF